MSYPRFQPAKRGAYSLHKRGSYEPPCPHYPHCIGCPLINVPYPEQLQKKREIVARALAAYPSLAHVEAPSVIASPHRLGYRTRVKLVVRSTRGEVATGLYVPGTHRVIDISSCPVHPRPVNQVTRYLKGKLVELRIAPYDERNDSGQLRYLDFRYGFARRELSVTLVTRHREFPQGIALARSLSRKFPFITGVIQNINEQRGNVIWGDRYQLLSGRDSLLEQVGSLKFGFPAGVFSQANPSTAKKLYDMVAEMAALGGRENVVDLYCGVGSISASLAKAAHLVWGIDESSLSIDTAKQNARRNGISNCRFCEGDVGEKIAEAQKTLAKIDRVVLNPPRKGVQPAAMEAILAVKAPKIIYVSCEPKSLARDLDRLVTQGYRIVRLQPLDMFPQTEQVENVVLLERC
ncbi:MAG: 23S rRNA (uracil(1939)-C(5))-methyltransferase RlmD [Candidatus Binatia bacterium]